MSDFLLGKEVSGTPLETRRGVVDYTSLLRNIMQGRGGEQIGAITAPFEPLVTDALMALLSVPQIAESVVSPADRTRGLFASLEPFEQRQTEEQVAGLRNIFGSVGGRFGRNVATAEAQTRGELSNQFTRARQEALLAANNQRMNFLTSLFQPAVQSAQLSLAPFNLFGQQFQAGPPIFQEGALPGLVSAASNIYLAQSLFGGTPKPAATPAATPRTPAAPTARPRLFVR